MPFLEQPFRHDVFVSYSHGAFDSDDHSPLKLWSQRFVKDLERQIRTIRLFRGLAVFLDEDQRPDQGVDPTDPLTKGLKSDIKASGILLVLITPDYLESEWCTNERDWWLEQNSNGPIGIDGRIVPCRILPNVTGADDWWPDTDHEAWPDAFKDLPGLWFHSRENVDLATVPFCWEGSTDDKNAYNNAMRDLVRRMTNRLIELKQRQRDLAEEAANLARLAGGSQVIYLHAREQHAAAWDDVRDTLRHNGHTILPMAPEAHTDERQLDPELVWQARRERIRQLADCDALLMLCTEVSPELDTDLLTIGHRDRQSACDLSGKLLPCALLNQAGSRIPTAEDFAIEALDGNTRTWPDDVAAWLQRCGHAAEAGP